MAGMGKWKLGLGIGCGVLLLVVVGILGVATWYATRINAEYKEVADSETALLAATQSGKEYRPPEGGIPPVERIEVFLEVREELNSWRRTMASGSAQFVADRQSQQTGGVKDMVKLITTGSDLMPLYAGFWIARNESLMAHGMGPDEYSYIFKLVYHTWLDLGREGVRQERYPKDALTEVLEPYGDQLRATYDNDVAVLELIFQKDNQEDQK